MSSQKSELLKVSQGFLIKTSPLRSDDGNKIAGPTLENTFGNLRNPSGSKQKTSSLSEKAFKGFQKIPISYKILISFFGGFLTLGILWGWLLYKYATIPQKEKLTEEDFSLSRKLRETINSLSVRIDSFQTREELIGALVSCVKINAILHTERLSSRKEDEFWMLELKEIENLKLGLPARILERGAQIIKTQPNQSIKNSFALTDEEIGWIVREIPSFTVRKAFQEELYLGMKVLYS